jgi:hypothetical protein
MGRAASLCSLLALASAVACATGVNETDEFEQIGGTDGGYGGIGGTDTTTTTTSTTDAGGFGGDGGYGGGGGNAGGGGAGAGPSCDFTSPNVCASAEGLASVAGDESSPTVTANGSTSKWFVILVEERVSSIFDEDLSYTVTLQSPPGMDYDLYVLHGPEDGPPNCNATPQQGQPLGNLEAVSASWDDDQPLGGEDDSVYLCIEVRWISGDLCGSSHEWTLSIDGNT